MKKILLAASLLAICVGATAQSFTVANDDGVMLSYSVTSADDQTVALTANNYTGRVVVPETVLHNDTLWTVTSIGNAFQGSSVTYVNVPASVTTVAYRVFGNCMQLDTVWFASEEPYVLGEGYFKANRFLFDSRSANPPLVVVPCGSLRAYRSQTSGSMAARLWNEMPNLTSPCAVPFRVIPTIDSICRVDSVWIVSNSGGASLAYSNRDYEVGDTAFVMAQRWVEGYNSVVKHGYFIGWSNGNTDPSFNFVVEQADTIYCIVDTFHHASLSASRISTPVYQFGNLAYDGEQANYRFQDLAQQPSPSTIYSTALWVGSHDSLFYLRSNWMLQHDDSTTVPHLAAVRFFANGSDYFPGPLRLADAATDLQTVLSYNRVWHVTREMIDEHVNNVHNAGYSPVEDILTWPGNGPEGYAAQLAPYYDADSDGVYNPLRGDYPLIRGDECVFSIFNDAFGSHGESFGKPLGIEVHAMTYSFHEPADTALWNTVFVHYDIYNRSQVNYPNTFFSAWTDFDLGYAWDDFVGCDVQHGMYYAYNGKQGDGPGTGSFEGVPPAQGCVFLGGAMLPADGNDNPAIGPVDNITPGDTLGNMAVNGCGFGDGVADNERMGMTNFMYYNNSSSAVEGEPNRAADYYNYMHSYWKNCVHLHYGGNGISAGTTDYDASFMFPGESDPWYWGTNGASVEPWSEVTAGNVPGDRRAVGSSGGFTFEAGLCQQFDLAYTTGFGETDVASSVEALRQNVDNVRRQWLHDTTDSGRPFTYRPYVAPVSPSGIDGVDALMFNVWPNPTNGTMTIRLPQASDVQLYDMMGRQLLTKHLPAGSSLLDLRSLPQGIYLLRSGGQTQRVVKK